MPKRVSIVVLQMTAIRSFLCSCNFKMSSAQRALYQICIVALRFFPVMFAETGNLVNPRQAGDKAQDYPHET